MVELYTKIDQIKTKINDIKDDKYSDIFNSLTDILTDLSSKVEDLSLRQEYLEENIEYRYSILKMKSIIEVSFDELSDLEDEYVEIKCEKCSKPLFVEQQALNNNNSIPCPFCGKIAKE